MVDVRVIFEAERVKNVRTLTCEQQQVRRLDRDLEEATAAAAGLHLTQLLQLSANQERAHVLLRPKLERRAVIGQYVVTIG
ncbi:hypothetical protein ABVT39_021592 [Epinephelus coioides]